MESQEPIDPLLRNVLVPEHVVFRSFAAETVVLNLQSQKFHGLNASAGRMVDVLAREKTVAAALTEIARDFKRSEDEIRPYLLDFVETMLERGLLVLADG